MMTTEVRQDSLGCYTQVWPNGAPEIGRQYRVLSDVWNDDYTTRTVWEWEYAIGEWRGENL